MNTKRPKPAAPSQRPKPAGASWSDAVGKFLDQLAIRRSVLTHGMYRKDLADFEAWYGETNGQAIESVTEVTSVDMHAWQQAIQARPGRAFANRPRQPTMPNTVNRKLAALHAFLAWAAKNDLINRAADRPDRSHQQQLAPRWLNPREQHALKKALELKGVPLHRGLILFDLYSGLRCAELAALLWNDVSVSDRKGIAIVRHGKGSKLREVPLGHEARKALDIVRPAAPIVPDQHVFTLRRRPLSQRGIRFIVQTYSQLARLPSLTTHVLRHTFAHEYLEAGGTIQQLARILGHEDINTTARYVTPSLGELQDVVEGMGRSSR